MAFRVRAPAFGICRTVMRFCTTAVWFCRFVVRVRAHRRRMCIIEAGARTFAVSRCPPGVLFCTFAGQFCESEGEERVSGRVRWQRSRGDHTEWGRRPACLGPLAVPAEEPPAGAASGRLPHSGGFCRAATKPARAERAEGRADASKNCHERRRFLFP